jgi:hypothetical protein
MLKADEYEKSPLYTYASPLQKTCGYLALLCSLIGLILIITWMNCDGFENACFNGFNFNRQIFNFHPVFMYTGFLLFGLMSLLSYRVIPLTKAYTKKIHGLLHTCALFCIVIGLTCVIVGNNFKNHNDGGEDGKGSYYANFASLHSFIGLGTIAVYFQNYLFGAYHFLSSVERVPVEDRKEYMPIHVYLGSFSFILSLIAVSTGIMGLYAEVGCGYEVTSPDTNPASNYHELAYGCRVANGAGVMVILVALFGGFALFNFRGEQRKEESTYLINN